jgi:hypothetical protein
LKRRSAARVGRADGGLGGSNHGIPILPDITGGYEDQICEWPPEWDKVTDAFFDQEMMDVLGRLANPDAKNRGEDVARFLECFAMITGALYLDPDALCVYRCGMTFYRADAEYPVYRCELAEVAQLPRRSNVTIWGVRFQHKRRYLPGMLKWMGASPKYHGSQSGKKWQGPPRELQQNMIAVFSHMPVELLAQHDSHQWGCWSITKGAVQGGRDPRVAAAFVPVTRDAFSLGEPSASCD